MDAFDYYASITFLVFLFIAIYCFFVQRNYKINVVYRSLWIHFIILCIAIALIRFFLSSIFIIGIWIFAGISIFYAIYQSRSDPLFIELCRTHPDDDRCQIFSEPNVIPTVDRRL